MKNNEISTSWVANRLGVSEDLIIKWVSLFGEYLSSEAKALSKTKKFTLHDMHILAVVNDVHDWEEDDGDYSDVRSAMNEGLPYEPHYQLIAHLNFPVFQDVPEDLDETFTHGALVGVIGLTDKLWVAQSFKLSADLLVDASIEDESAFKTVYPILYNYRHSIELYLKIISGSKERIHNLNKLLRSIEEKYGLRVSRWVNEFITELHEIDERSTTFRYGEDVLQGEKWVDLRQLKNVVGLLCSEIEKLLHSKSF